MKKLLILWIVATAMAASAWGACRLNDGYAYSDFRCSQLNGSLSYCQGSFDCAGNHCWNPSSGGTNKSYVGVRGFYCGCGSGAWACCSYLVCDTDCEADSAKTGGAIYECLYDAGEQRYYRWTCTGGNSCSSGGCQKTYYNDSTLCHRAKCQDFPESPDCEQEKDTTLYACSESVDGGAVTSTLYRLSCKAFGGQVVSCNGKTNVDIPTDGTPVKSMAGTCAQNGYQNGITGGEGDSTGTSADCFAVIADKCYMKDKRSGNTFTCDCDGSCDYALRQVASGDCVNPYPQDEQQGDSIALPFSSSDDFSRSSSSAEASSAASFGTELDALNNLYGVVDTIRDTLNRRIAPAVDGIQANTQYIGQQLETSNNYLQELALKDWSVNVSPPNVNVTNNTDVQGIENRQDRQYANDTSYQRRVLEALGALGDTSGVGNPSDTAGSGAALQGQLDKIDSAVGAFDVPDMGDSIAPTLAGIRGEVAAMRDSIARGAMGDSVDAWTDAFLNNGVLTGGGSNTCPAPLTRQVSFTFPHVGTIQAGTLGRYLCTPIAGFSVTLWQVARMLLRALVAIGCMWWLFKEVTGTTTGGQNDDD